MADPPVPRPVAEPHLADEPWLDPVVSPTCRSPRVERGRVPPKRLEALPEPLQVGTVEARADLRHVDEPPAVVDPDVEGAEAGPAALGLRVAADHEFLAAMALDLEPRVRAPRDVGARGSLGQDALEPGLRGRLEEGRSGSLYVVAVARDPERREHPMEAGLSRRQRHPPEVVPLEGEAVEEHGLDGDGGHRAGHVPRPGEAHAGLESLEARDAARVERDDLAVDQELIEGKRAERGDDLGIASRHDLAAPPEERYRVAPTLRQHSHPVVLDLEEPVRALRRPVGQGREHEPLLAGAHGPDRRPESPELCSERVAHGACVPHLLERQSGADRAGVALGGLRPRDRLAGLPDQEPLLVLPAHPCEAPAAAQLVAAELHLDEPALELGQEILGLRRAIAPVVPHDDGAGTVVVLRDDALEVGVLERVVLDVDGQALDLGPERRALGDCPALEHPGHLQAEVVVEAPGGVLLDDEEAAASPAGHPRRAPGCGRGRASAGRRRAEEAARRSLGAGPCPRGDPKWWGVRGRFEA